MANVCVYNAEKYGNNGTDEFSLATPAHFLAQRRGLTAHTGNH